MVSIRYKIVVLSLFLTVSIGFSQQQGVSADRSEQVNSDAFQEYFFEALKQKSIENYDRAIIALLECKKLQENNEVVDYELGLNYMQQTNYIQAQQHFEVATTADPSNIWYQDALLNCLIKQDNYHAAVSVAESLLSMDKDYYKVLAEIYIELGQWVQAKKIIDKMLEEGIDIGEATQLQSKLRMQTQTEKRLASEEGATNSIPELLNSPMDQYKNQIEKQLEKTDYAEALHYSSEAIDNFPTQPLFYLYKARSLNKLQNYKMAIQILEDGLSYILDPGEMENNFYKEFVVAYTALGDHQKVDYYQKKIKN